MLLGRHLSNRREIPDLYPPPRDLGLAIEVFMVFIEPKCQLAPGACPLFLSLICGKRLCLLCKKSSLYFCTVEWLPIFNVLWQGRVGLEPSGPATRSLLAWSALWVFLLSVAGDIPRLLRCLSALKRGTAAVMRDAQGILYGSAVVMLCVGGGGKLIYCWVRCICLALALGPVTALLSP